MEIDRNIMGVTIAVDGAEMPREGPENPGNQSWSLPCLRSSATDATKLTQSINTMSAKLTSSHFMASSSIDICKQYARID
jgi:hypothetical protein